MGDLQQSPQPHLRPAGTAPEWGRDGADTGREFCLLFPSAHPFQKCCYSGALRTNSGTRNTQSCLSAGEKQPVSSRFLLSQPSQAGNRERGRETSNFSGFPATPLPLFTFSSIFLEQLLILCPAGCRHQGEVRLALKARQKKAIVVAGFSSSRVYFDFHILKKKTNTSPSSRGKKWQRQQKSCSFLEESRATESEQQLQDHPNPICSQRPHHEGLGMHG